MSSKKRDLEIIYSLQWKDKSANGGDKANIIGMYDIPATTLNWEVFKSYLLKNSGAGSEDVKVYYITDSNREFPIESQTDFQIALYAFRRKARMGDIVNLKLERVSGIAPPKTASRTSNDVETQSDNTETVSLTSACCNAGTPPEWFMNYMEQFKKDVHDDIAKTVLTMLSNFKPHTSSQPAYHSRKSKPDSSKRIRKHPAHILDNQHEAKDLLKSLKLEGKLERKLEKLEHKTKKIREKKIALLARSSDSEAGQSSSRSCSRKDETEDFLNKMDAAPILSQNVVPHMLGGEIYLHCWKVINTGCLPWTDSTLSYTWGSKALKPLDTEIPVPVLFPNEIATLSVRLQIPQEPGQYECYFHFHQCGRRFGHWLGCQVIVDPFDLKGNKSVLDTSSTIPSYELSVNTESPIQTATFNYTANSTASSHTYSDNYEIMKYENDSENKLQQPPDFDLPNTLVRNLSRSIDNMKLQDTNFNSDSDNQSIVSLNEGTSSRKLAEEFVMVPIPDCFKVDNIPAVNEAASADLLDLNTSGSSKENDTIPQTNMQDAATDGGNCDDNNNDGKRNQNLELAGASEEILSNYSQRSEIVFISLDEDRDVGSESDYAYVFVEGQKAAVPVPKKIIKSEYLEHAEKNIKTPAGNVSRASSCNGSSVEIVNEADLTTDCSDTPQKETQASLGEAAKENHFSFEQIEASKVLYQQAVKTLIETFQEAFNSPEEYLEIGDRMSHCSAVGTCYSDGAPSMEASSRVFVFPQNFPGYELLNQYMSLPYIPVPQEQKEEQPATITRSTHPLNLTTHDRNPFSDHLNPVPNYQQTPPENRNAPEYVPIYPNQELFEASFLPNNENFMSATDLNVTEPTAPPTDNNQTASACSSVSGDKRQENVVHLLPETLVTGAVNVASSAINTARSVINMIRPQEEPGTWINGRWMSSSKPSVREANLYALAEMGFWDRDLNATLLARYNDDLSKVVAELVQ